MERATTQGSRTGGIRWEGCDSTQVSIIRDFSGSYGMCQQVKVAQRCTPRGSCTMHARS